jgi:hypothetical protein
MGEGVYTLVTEDGEGLCSHFCSQAAFAPGDLYSHRPERKPMFDAKGVTECVWLEDSGLSIEELTARNHAFGKAAPSVREDVQATSESRHP